MQAGDPDRAPQRLVSVFPWMVILFACLDLAGWWWHLPILTSVFPHYATMKPNTALCLGLVAVAVMGRRRPLPEAREAWGVVAFACAGAAFLISGASLVEYLTHRDFGIDQILAAVPMERFGDPAGRMSLGTAVCLFLTSGAVLVLDRVSRLSTGLVLLSLAASASGLIGFILQAGPLSEVIWFRSLAVHTATALLLLQIAILALRPLREPFRALAQAHRREGRRRSLLFAVLVLPVLLALPVVAGLEARLYDTRFALAFLVVLLMGVQTFLLWADNIALERVESRLRENEAESSRILQSIGDAVIVTDTTSRVVRMNPLAEELTGWTLPEARGKTLTDVFTIFSEITGEAVENPVDVVMRFGRVVGMANHTVLRRRDGHAIHIDDSSAPIRDKDGQLTGIVLVFRNVDDRKASEALLRASEHRLRAALDAARLGSWELDLRTMEMECSPVCKANFGRAPEDAFPYREMLDSIDPEDLPAMQSALRIALEEQKVYRAEYRVLWPDGTSHWIIASGQVLTNLAGEPERMVGVTLDVTERHRSAAALIQSEKLAAVGRLASSIAHEINNPLESVTNLLYLMRNHAESPEIQSYVAVAERELQRASAITNQTLRFHKQSTSPKEVTCEELIEGVLSIYQGKIVNSNISIEKHRLAKKPLLCFEGEIRQVLSNLIGNAIDAMSPGGGRLLLRSREATDWRSGERGIVLTVADTGAGMSATTAQRLFEPFYTTKGIAGTGLGLWISHEIVLRHRGLLRVRSCQKEGRRGTVFALFLPFDAASRST